MYTQSTECSLVEKLAVCRGLWSPQAHLLTQSHSQPGIKPDQSELAPDWPSVSLSHWRTFTASEIIFIDLSSFASRCIVKGKKGLFKQYYFPKSKQEQKWKRAEFRSDLFVRTCSEAYDTSLEKISPSDSSGLEAWIRLMVLQRAASRATRVASLAVPWWRNTGNVS